MTSVADGKTGDVGPLSSRVDGVAGSSSRAYVSLTGPIVRVVLEVVAPGPSRIRDLVSRSLTGS